MRTTAAPGTIWGVNLTSNEVYPRQWKWRWDGMNVELARVPGVWDKSNHSLEDLLTKPRFVMEYEPDTAVEEGL